MAHSELSRLPKIDDATLIDMLSERAPSQRTLWDAIGNQGQSAFATGAVIRVAQLEAAGLSPRDAGLYMAAWAFALFNRQTQRNANIPTLRALFERNSESGEKLVIPETIKN